MKTAEAQVVLSCCISDLYLAMRYHKCYAQPNCPFYLWFFSVLFCFANRILFRAQPISYIGSKKLGVACSYKLFLGIHNFHYEGGSSISSGDLVKSLVICECPFLVRSVFCSFFFFGGGWEGEGVEGCFLLILFHLP